MTRAAQLTDVVTHHGEGPLWVDGELTFVDMLAGDVMTLAADGQVARRHVGTVAAALRPRAGGGFVYAVERGFALDDGSGTPVRAQPELWSATSIRMNEGGCDPAGNFYCGSMAYDQAPGAASMYRLGSDGVVTTAFTGVTISNGLDWSPTGELAYYNDTATHGIDVFDWDAEHGLTNRRRFAAVDGSPDGLTVDAEGGVWVALFGGAAVHRYDADGTLSAVIEVGASQVSACTFGGAGLATLYITTSREGLSASDEPAAGSIFSVDPGVTGRPARPYAG